MHDAQLSADIDQSINQYKFANISDCVFER